MATETRSLSGIYVADPTHSSVVFGVRHMNVAAFRARFAHVEARLVADGAELTLEGQVPVESVSITEPPEFRKHVVYGSEFFDAREHPAIGFRSSRLDLADDGSARLEGELMIKGISKWVSAGGSYQPPIEDPFGATRAALELQATVDRRDWGMDWQLPLPDGGDALAYEVELTVHLELVREG
jgi:polyisoprenoid-binding protein YceI